MDLHTTLTIITMVGLTISFIGGLLSQLWKGSVEIEGQLRKQLTPAGWLSLGIALVGLSASVASELIRVNIQNNDKVAAEAADRHKKALEEQQAQWRETMQVMLSEAKKGIEKNVEDTLSGFADSQRRLTETQTQIVTSRQDVLENAVRNTNKIIVASQPLISLSFSWTFHSTSPELWDTMTKGEAAIDENNNSVQGGVPLVRYDIMQYEAKLLPLLRQVVRLVDSNHAKPVSSDSDDPSKGATPEPGIRAAVPKENPQDDDRTRRDEDDEHTAEKNNRPAAKADTRAIVVLISLDESRNAILSFGEIGGAKWYRKGGATTLSAGFLQQQNIARAANANPQAIAELVPERDAGASKYGIEWTLDPLTLTNSIDRRVATIPSTARLPKVLNVTIFYDTKTLPFQQNNFAKEPDSLWYKHQDIPLDEVNIRDMELNVTVNGLSEFKYSYRLARAQRVSTMTDAEDEIETKCTVLQFESQS